MSLRAEVDALLERGQDDQAIARCRDVLADFSAASDVKGRHDVFRALAACAGRLTDTGRLREALGLINEIRERFGEDPADRMRQFVVEMIVRAEAPIWNALEQPENAILALDRAWLIASSTDGLMETGTGVEVLLRKAALLHSLDRPDEAVVVVDSAMRAISEATAASEVGRAKKALKAVLYKLEDLLTAGRDQEVTTLGQQLGDLLSGFATELPAGASAPPEPARCERELAKALAECTAAEVWSELEAADQPLSTEVLIQRAIQLYRIAAAWNAIPAISPPGAADAAAEVIRNFADAHAMLTITLTDEQRARVPLPRRAEVAAVLSTTGVYEWAAEQGHPLMLPDPAADPDAGENVDTLESSEEHNYNTRFVRDILMLTYFYEFLAVLERFEEGPQAAHEATLQRQIQYLLIAKQAVGRLIFVGETGARTGAGLIGLLIARAIFLRAYDQADGDPVALPSASELREILHQTGAYDWLTEQGAALPPWTQPE